jgi:hypothetical protein
MTRTNVLAVSAFLAGLVVASIPSGAPAHGYSYGNDTDPDELGWAIVSGEMTSMSDMKDLDSMDKLKAEYGEEFLYIRLSENRYVIRDRALMKRAKDAARPMQQAGREIGIAAKAQAVAALAGSRDARERAKLAARIAKLSGRMARMERRGEDTADLEREQELLEQTLEDVTVDSEEERHAARQEQYHSARTKAAQERLHKEVRRLNGEMRDILRDAKSRHLAESVN